MRLIKFNVFYFGALFLGFLDASVELVLRVKFGEIFGVKVKVFGLVFHEFLHGCGGLPRVVCSCPRLSCVVSPSSMFFCSLSFVIAMYRALPLVALGTSLAVWSAYSTLR